MRIKSLSRSPYLWGCEGTFQVLADLSQQKTKNPANKPQGLGGRVNL
jgi:hypothetical protein